MSVFNFFKKTDGNDLEAVVNPDKKKKNFLSQFLPEDENKKAALARGLMMGGASMMAAGGPSSKPTNLLSVLGHGIAGGAGGYDDALTTDAELAKSQVASSESQVKLKLLADNQSRAKDFIAKHGSPSENGYSIEALYDLHALQMSSGDDASARETQKQIQALQQQAADSGMVLGEDGSYRLADGYGDSLYDTKRHESLGTAVGDNAKLTTEQKDYVFGQENPAFRAYETAQKRAGVAGADKFGGKSDELAAERFAQYQLEGLQAKDTVANMGRLADLSRSIGTGKVAELTKTFGPYAAAMGIDVDGLDDIQLFDSMVSKMAPAMRVPGSGASSDLDVTMFLKALPTLSNTTEGNALIAETTSAIESNKIAAAEIANRVFEDELTWQEAEKLIQGLPDPYTSFRAFRESTGSISSDEGQSTPAGSGATVVMSDADYNNLPAGAAYRFPDDEPSTVRHKR